MSKKLLIIFKDKDDNDAQISIQDIKDGVTKAEASTLANYLISNKLVTGKKAELATFNKAYVIQTTSTEL